MTRMRARADSLGDLRRAFTALAHEHPDVGLKPLVRSFTEARRNFQRWAKANPESAIDRYPVTLAECRRNLQIIREELT